MAHRAHVLPLILMAAAGWGAVGLLAGFAPSSAEPGGLFVDCGPALFGRPAPLPDPACADSYAPLDTVSIVALTISALTLLLALGVLVASHTKGSRPVIDNAKGRQRVT
jgi:hypothetical protein